MNQKKGGVRWEIIEKEKRSIILIKKIVNNRQIDMSVLQK